MSEIEDCQKCVLGTLENNVKWGKSASIGTKFEVIFVLQSPKMNKTNIEEVQMLRNVCTEVGIKEEDYGILYMVKCSNIDNSPPNIEIILQCTEEHLVKELDKYKPRIIIAVGRVVSDYFGAHLGGSTRWKKSRVFSVYSPTAEKYNPQMKTRIIEMFKWIRDEIYNKNTMTKWSE